MKRSGLLVCAVMLGSLLSLVGCGYYFPHVYDGPEQTIYMPDWPNRTSKLGLDNRIYQTVSRWFQKSSKIRVTKERAGATYVLAGEIKGIDLPSVSWDGITRASGVNVKLVVRYVLKNVQTGEIVWEVPAKLYTADYTESTVNAANDEIALREIVDDMAEDIYMGTLHRIRRQALNQARQEATPGEATATGVPVEAVPAQ